MRRSICSDFQDCASPINTLRRLRPGVDLPKSQGSLRHTSLIAAVPSGK